MTAAEIYIEDFLAKARTALGELSLKAVRELSRIGMDGTERDAQYLLYNSIKILENTHSDLSSREKIDMASYITALTNLNSYIPHPNYTPASGCSLKVAGQPMPLLSFNKRLSDLEERVSIIEKVNIGGGSGIPAILYGGTPRVSDFQPSARF